MNLKVKNALISVSNKKNLISLLKTLKEFNINIISSGGTYTSIRKLGYQCTELSKYTGFKEILDGRVKTLNPKIHGGILFRRDDYAHLEQIKKHDIYEIDLLIINLYKFRETLQKTSKNRDIIENIDIGGPAMIRAGAKNHEFVTVVTDPNDYPELIS